MIRCDVLTAGIYDASHSMEQGDQKQFLLPLEAIITLILFFFSSSLDLNLISIELSSMIPFNH
jgi:hypothetical protein